MKAGIVSRTDNQDSLAVAKKIIEFLKARGVDVHVETDTALSLGLDDGNSQLSDLDGDFIVTIGGDGTILKTAMEMKHAETPILGVNMGRRGFLASVTVTEAEQALNRVLDKDYFLEESLKVSSRCLDSDIVMPDGLNEVLVASSLPSKMLLLELSVDDDKITEVQADGALVATPAGSTAYNLSAGGSIVTPKVNAFVLTAICPYSYFKSLVLPKESKINIKLMKPKAEGMVIVDGRAFSAVKPFSNIECTVSPHKTRFIRFQSFYTRIKKRVMYL
ncbi:MAG: NAD(+)/NADH kinase [Candidatus Bathyarchaeota archaeon]|nr:NAD(+)/NADH kinase [Candidatus Bathyarchaeota archaeon]